MDVILVNPPSTSRIERIFGTGISYLEVLGATYLDESVLRSFPGENLGLEYVAGDLKANGHLVEIIDACLEEKNIEAVIKNILEKMPILVGFTGPEAIFGENLEIINQIRTNGYKGHITVGGDFATKFADELLEKNDYINTVCLGEGERVISELLDCIKRGNDLNTVHNIAYRKDGKIISDNPKIWQNLDEINWPARDQAKMVLKKGLSLSISTSRGCPYKKCKFCNAIKGWRFRTPESVLDEIEYLISSFNTNKITFVDEDFIGPEKTGEIRAEQIAKGIINRGFDLNYMIDCRVDRVDKKLFTLLKKSGLHRVFLGFESGIQRILNIYKKGITVDQSKKALKILNDLDIDVVPGFIFFDPFCTIDEMIESLEFYKQIGYYDMIRFAHRLHIDASMPIYNVLIKENKVKRNLMDDRYDFSDNRIRMVHHALWKYIRNIFPSYLIHSKNRTLLSQKDISALKDRHLMLFESLLKNSKTQNKKFDEIVDFYICQVGEILSKTKYVY